MQNALQRNKNMNNIVKTASMSLIGAQDQDHEENTATKTLIAMQKNPDKVNLHYPPVTF